jgi:hypothetical protein
VELESGLGNVLGDVGMAFWATMRSGSENIARNINAIFMAIFGLKHLQRTLQEIWYAEVSLGGMP